MAAPDETTWKVFDYAWAGAGGLLMIIWNMLNGKIENNHKNLHKRLEDVDGELDKQRDTQAKLFDKLEDLRKEGNQRHIELLQYLRDKH